MNEEEVGPKTDKEGRIIDKTGRPLRDKNSRSHGPGPFRGGSGKPHPKTARLEARQKDFDADKQHSGRHRPGSYNK